MKHLHQQLLREFVYGIKKIAYYEHIAIISFLSFVVND